MPPHLYVQHAIDQIARLSVTADVAFIGITHCGGHRQKPVLITEGDKKGQIARRVVYHSMTAGSCEAEADLIIGAKVFLTALVNVSAKVGHKELNRTFSALLGMMNETFPSYEPDGVVSHTSDTSKGKGENE